jgi:hypothetical protein
MHIYRNYSGFSRSDGNCVKRGILNEGVPLLGGAIDELFLAVLFTILENIN